jgi:hypothetical protein
MEELINCGNCKTNVVIVEDNLFYSDEKSKVQIFCPVCNYALENRDTDGWFFVQTEAEHKKEKEK